MSFEVGAIASCGFERSRIDRWSGSRNLTRIRKLCSHAFERSRVHTAELHLKPDPNASWRI